MLGHLSIRRRGVWAATILSVTLVGLLLPNRLFAQKPERETEKSLRETTSLAFVPADASFYAASLRNREKVEAIAGSKAFAAIMEMPLVQMGIAQAMKALSGESDAKEPEDDDPDLNKIDDEKDIEDEAGGAPANPADIIKLLMADRKLLALLMEMASEEMFIYGDQQHGNFMNLYQQLGAKVSEAQYAMLFSGQFEPDDPAQMLLPALELLEKNIDKLKVPTTVIGFRIKNTDNAAAQLAKLEKLIKEAIAKEPKLAKAFKREKVGDDEFLVLRGDGSMIPWDKVPLDELGDAKEKMKAIIAKLKKLTVAVSLGVRGNYILLSIAPGTDHLLTLGKGKLLIDRPEMAPVLKASGKRLSSIGYVSDRYIKAIGGGTQSLDAILSGAQKGLVHNTKLDADIKKRLGSDLEELSKDIKSFVPETAGMTSYSFMTDRGIEGYIHNRSEDRYGDGSKRLDILDHLGGKPLAFTAGRRKYSTRGYDTLVKWIKRGKFYFEEVGLAELDETKVAQYKAFKETYGPLLERVHLATRNKLMPSLKDGQVAIVLDGKLKSKQWTSEMPLAKTPLPLPSFGVVLGVSDKSLLKEAFEEYAAVGKATFKEARDAADDLVGGDLPDFEFPKLQKREFNTTSGKFEVYYYSLEKFPKSRRREKLKEAKGLEDDADEEKEEEGAEQEFVTVHKWLAPNIGLSNKFAALSFSPLHTKWMLEKRPLAIDSGPLLRRDRPLVSAAYFNWAGMVDMVVPWIDYGYEEFQRNQQAKLAEFGIEPDPEAAAQQKMILDQVHAVVNILKCFREYSSVTYKDAAGKNVTHYEWRFQDLP